MVAELLVQQRVAQQRRKQQRIDPITMRPIARIGVWPSAGATADQFARRRSAAMLAQNRYEHVLADAPPGTAAGFGELHAFGKRLSAFRQMGDAGIDRIENRTATARRFTPAV
jgi:hypothetical protein